MAKQRVTRSRQYETASLTVEQGDTEPLLQLLDACGDIGRDTMQPLRRPRHAALSDHAAEDVQIVQIHHSHIENYASHQFSFQQCLGSVKSTSP